MALLAERRLLFRLSFALNIVLIIVPLYILLKDGSLDASSLGSVFSSVHESQENAALVGDGSPLLGNINDDFVSTSAAAVVTPVRECGICEAGDLGRELCNTWGEPAMQRAISYAGSNHRLRRLLHKLRRGEPFSMGVIGGSVSAGHGLHVRGKNLEEKIMHKVFFNHLNGLFPQPGGIVESMSASKRNGSGDVNVFFNGAQPARGSDYYALCMSLHLPQDVDLVVVELAINDQSRKEVLYTFENMLRVIYEMPSQPAVLMVNTFALMFDEIATGGDFSAGVAQYYDTPIVSTRNALLPLGFENQTRFAEWFGREGGKEVVPETLKGVDLRHFGPVAHVFTGDLMSAYIDMQLCEMDKVEARMGTTDVDRLYPLPQMPPNRIMDKYVLNSVFPKLTPFCRATNSDEFPLTPVTQNGWEPWAYKDKKYLRAMEPGAKLTFEFETVVGKVSLYYLRAHNFGLGNLKCMIDDDEKTAQVIEGHWKQPYNIGQSTTWNTKPGKHVLSCEVTKETADPGGSHEFRLMAIMGT